MSRLRRGARWTPPPPADEVAEAVADVNARHAAQATVDPTPAVPSPDRMREEGCVECGALPTDPCGRAGNAPASCRLSQTDLDAMVGVDDPPGPAPAGEVVDGEPVPARKKKAELIIHPATGEAIAVVRDTPTNVLAELRSALVDHERSVFKRWKRMIDAEIRDRLDAENVRSAVVGPARGTRWKVTVPAATTTEWDGEAAYKAVRELVRQGLISAAAAGRCVERVVEYKAKHAELKKLADHADERVRDAVRECRTIADVEDRRVTVTPVRTGRSKRDDT